MLKKKLGVEAVEMDWPDDVDELKDYYKVPSTLIIPPGCERIGEFAFLGVYGVEGSSNSGKCKGYREICF